MCSGENVVRVAPTERKKLKGAQYYKYAILRSEDTVRSQNSAKEDKKLLFVTQRNLLKQTVTGHKLTRGCIRGNLWSRPFEAKRTASVKTFSDQPYPDVDL